MYRVREPADVWIADPESSPYVLNKCPSRDGDRDNWNKDRATAMLLHGVWDSMGALVRGHTTLLFVLKFAVIVIAWQSRSKASR